MPAGGARTGAGRKKIDPLDPVTLCCGAVFEATIAFDLNLRAEQFRRQIARKGAAAVSGYEELKEIRSGLSIVPLKERKAYVKKANIAENDDSKRTNRINDADDVIKESLQRFWPSHKLSNTDLGYIYQKIRLAVWGRFRIELSTWQIKKRIKNYQKALPDSNF